MNPESREPGRAASWRDPAVAAVFMAGYLALALATLRPEWLGVPFDLSRVVWIPSGLAVAFALHYGHGIAIWVFVSEITVTLLTGDRILFALGAGVGNTLEVGVASLALSRLRFDRTLARGRDVVALVGVGAGLSALVGALVSVSALVFTDPGIPATAWSRITVLWWLTHANGILLGTPLLLALWHGSFRRLRDRSVEAALLATAVLGVGILLFDPGSGGEVGRRLLYTPFPLLLWCAFRFRLVGAAAANVLLAVPAMITTSIPAGPFASPVPTVGNEALIQLWIFVGVNAITALFVASVVEEREREVEARLAAEAERRALADRMHQAQRAESLGVLAGGIAHDFNNLLVSIMGNADLAEQRIGENHPAGASVTEILRASQRAAEICRQMLAYAGRGRVSNGVVDIGEVASEMTELLAVSFGPEIDLSVRVEDTLPPVWGDVTQLRRVVLNLLTNAADALPPEGGEIRVVAGRFKQGDLDSDDVVAGTLEGTGPFVHLTVADDGRGMDPAIRDRIFEPFFTTKEMGRGLGLAAVIGIVQAHGGVLELRSGIGEGARFRIVLPVTDRTEAIGPTDPVRSRPDSAGGSEFDRTVLLVDDEPAVREVVGTMLRNAGARVLSASDGLEAIEIYRSADRSPDVVLLDLMMPRMDGAETLERLRRIDPDVTVIVTTGNMEAGAELEDREGVLVLQKPYRSKELLEALRAVTRPDGRVRD